MSESDGKSIEVFATKDSDQNSNSFGFWVSCGGIEVRDGALRYDEVEKADKALAAAKEAKVKAEKRFLFSHGFKIVTDHDKEILRWKAPKEYRGIVTNRRDAVSAAKFYMETAKRDAEQKIADLKKQHGIVDGGAN